MGASFAVLLQVAEHRVRPLVTTALFLEYESVLKRPEQRSATGTTEEQVDGFMSEFAALAEGVDVHFLWRPQLADPSDEFVLEAMINGRGDALITHNTRHFSRAASRFGLSVLTPSEFIGRATL
jgi:predicted nucleic acid-binding protein